MRMARMTKGLLETLETAYKSPNYLNPNSLSKDPRKFDPLIIVRRLNQDLCTIPTTHELPSSSRYSALHLLSLFLMSTLISDETPTKDAIRRLQGGSPEPLPTPTNCHRQSLAKSHRSRKIDSLHPRLHLRARASMTISVEAPC